MSKKILLKDNETFKNMEVECPEFLYVSYSQVKNAALAVIKKTPKCREKDIIKRLFNKLESINYGSLLLLVNDEVLFSIVIDGSTSKNYRVYEDSDVESIVEAIEIAKQI